MAIIGQPLTSPEAGWKRYDDTDGALVYPNGGKRYSNSSWNGTDLVFDGSNGNPKNVVAVRFKFNGTKIRIITYGGSDRASDLKIVIDGASETFSQYSSSYVVQMLCYEKTELPNGTHDVVIYSGTNGSYSNFILDAIDIDDTGRLLHPDEVLDIKDLDIGKRIRCHYQAPISGQVGTFSGLGQETSDFIPVASSAMPNGDFYWICCDIKNGKKILIADRNIQNSISWDTLNNAGLTGGISKTPHYGINLQSSMNDSYVIISNDGLTYTGNKNDVNGWANMGVSKGKYVWEFIINTMTNYLMVGIAVSNADFLKEKGILMYMGQTSEGYSQIISNGSRFPYGSKYTSGDIIGIQLDMDNRTIEFFKNGISQGLLNLNPDIIGEVYPVIHTGYSGGVVTANFGLNKLNYNYSSDFEPYDNIFQRPNNYDFNFRLLKGGISPTDTDNEYDNLLVNGPAGSDNSTWYWQNIASWTSTTPSGNSYNRVIRGNAAANTWSSQASGTVNATTGFRPVLEIESTFTPTVKYLFEDNGEIKKWDSLNQTWISLGLAPATEELFLSEGMNNLSGIDDFALQSLISNTPKLLVYNDDPNKTSASVNLQAVPKGQLIFQDGDINISGGVETLSVSAIYQNASVIKIVLSIDGGSTWQTFDGLTWQPIPADAASVKDYGMTPDTVNSLSSEQIQSLLGDSTTLRFAYYLEQDQITDEVHVDQLTITPQPYATETPTLDGINITYDELTLEGRLKDLERINAINVAKLNFKTNSLLQSERYELFDLVIDTFETNDSVDPMLTTATYDPANKEYYGIGEVVTPIEELNETRSKLLICYEGTSVFFEFSLDGGNTWQDAQPDTLIDLSSLNGNQLRIKATLNQSSSKLSGLAYSWV